jgi:phage replication O-like protein O
MANPQAENGHTDINHETMEALYSANLSGGEFKIILFVLRKTWGWHKKSEIIKTGTLVTETKLSKKVVCESVNKLVTKKLLLLDKKKRKNTYTFNKDHEEWLVTERLLGSYENVTSKLRKRNPHKVAKRNSLKETTKRKTIGQTSCLEANEILSFYKQTYGFKKNVPKQLENWRAAKWLFEQYGVEKTCQAILAGKSALEDSVAGADKVPLIKNLMDLKEKYDQLRAYYGRKKSRQGRTLDLREI